MLVALDFDGALAVSDPFVRLGEQHGTSGDIAGVLDRMAAGDLDHETGLRSIADHLEGLPVEDADEAVEHLQLRDGASEIVSTLHRADHYVAIVSDAPERAVGSLLDPYALDVDTVVANRLPTERGALAGRIEGPLVGRGKDEVLKELAVRQGRNMGETIAVGDDRRDLPMLQAASSGIGIDPDPVVESQCDHTVQTIERLERWFEKRNLA